jgi:twitching motility two-component system response regulator PilG
MQFVLNGQVDRGWAASVVEMLKTEPESVGNHLSIALACCNLLDFAEARNYLAKAELLDGDAAQFVSDRMDAFLRRPIVLVVDDSATVRDGLARTLDSGGLLPIPIGESWTVLAVAQSQRPAVVLLDVNMPMMDGYEVCRQLRAHRDSKAVPVILISGRHGLMDKVMGKLAGASEYVTKPYPADKLMKIVQSYVPGKQ